MNNSLRDYIKNNSDNGTNEPFMIYDQEDKTMTNDFTSFEEKARKCLILYIDPSPKQPSEVMRNLVFALSCDCQQPYVARFVSL